MVVHKLSAITLMNLNAFFGAFANITYKLQMERGNNMLEIILLKNIAAVIMILCCMSREKK